MKIGQRVQLRQIVESLDDLAGVHSHGISTNPAAERLGAFFRAGFSIEDEKADLAKRIDALQKSWGEAGASTLSPAELERFPLLEATKIYALASAGISPAKVDISERLITAKGTVDGEPIAAREIFTQHFAPKGSKSGELIVVSPGFMETGRNFYEQIEMMLKRGHEVVVMDHQWAGYSDGDPGGLDRLYGAGRDVAAVLADTEQQYPGRKVTVFGNSMGGAAALAAVALSEQGRIQLDGDPKLPNKPKLMLQAPFLGMNEWWLNDALAFVASKPIMNPVSTASLPATGLPVIVDPTDPANGKKTSEWAVINDARGQLKTLIKANPDLEDLEAQLPKLDLKDRVAIVIGNKDRLASVEAAQRFAQGLGVSEHRFRVIASANHVMEQSSRDQGHAIQLLDGLIDGPGA